MENKELKTRVRTVQIGLVVSVIAGIIAIIGIIGSLFTSDYEFTGMMSFLLALAIILYIIAYRIYKKLISKVKSRKNEAVIQGINSRDAERRAKLEEKKEEPNEEPKAEPEAEPEQENEEEPVEETEGFDDAFYTSGIINLNKIDKKLRYKILDECDYSDFEIRNNYLIYSLLNESLMKTDKRMIELLKEGVFDEYKISSKEYKSFLKDLEGLDAEDCRDSIKSYIEELDEVFEFELIDKE